MLNSQPKTVLCTWEIGGDLGHIVRLVKVTKELESRGVNVVVALHDLSRAYPAFDCVNAQLLQAPVWLPKITMQRPIACLADTLLLMGYLEPAPLSAMVAAWQGLLDLVKPDLIIFDYSPTAMLAALNRNLPKIKIGSGFADPVPGHPIADWRPYNTQDDLIARQEHRVLHIVNAVQRTRGQPELSQLTDLFKTDETFISVYDVIDPYRGLRAVHEYCVGPGEIGTRKKAEFAHNGLPNVLAYVKTGYANLPFLCKAFAKVNANVYLVCVNGNEQQLKAYETERFRVSTAMVDFVDAFAKIQLFVGHGNANSVTESIYAGVPMLILPVHLEQLLVGKKIQAAGAGKLIELIKHENNVVDAMDELLANTSYQTNVAQIKVQAKINTLPIGQRVADVACRLLGLGN